MQARQLALIAPVLCLAGCFGKPETAPPQKGKLKLKTEAKMGRYTYRSYSGEILGQGAFEIWRGGKVMLREDGADYSISLDKKDSDLPEPGKDITGDGLPDLIVEVYSGGAHCCFEYLIVSLGEEVKKVDTIYGGNSSFEFKDLNGDGIYEAIGNDDTFAYWEAPYAESPMPSVILKFDGRKYAISDLMKRPAPSNEQLVARLEQLSRDQGESRWGIPPSTWGYMLELIYSGNGDLAWKFCDMMWAKRGKGNKEDFLSEFRKKLAESPYWDGIKSLNGWR
jgi:hypothetical protein